MVETLLIPRRSQIHATVTIDRPAEKVLEFIDDAENLATCSPLVVRAVDAGGRSEHGVGDHFAVVCQVLGMRFTEQFTVARFDAPPRHTPHRRFQMVHTLDGPVRGTFTWTLEAEGNQTYASLDASYELPGGVFGRLLDAVVFERAFCKHVDETLANLKRELAAEATVAPA